MSTTIEGMFNAKGKQFAIIASRFNELISTKLLEGAKDCLIRHMAEEKSITVYWVPGSFEVPVLAQKLAGTKKYDAIICLGAIIRGATPHFDYVAAEAAKGIAHVSLENILPISFGILTCDTIEQALERAGTKAGNKGWDAALSAIEMVDLFSKI
jgi:6,7-dimethyl-8-ribityllumazine synthase